MAQSLFKRLKQLAPDSEIHVLAPAWSRPLLERMPQISRAIDMPLGHGRLALKTRWKLGKSLRGRYAQAILLPNSWKSAIVPFSANIPLRTGWLGEMRFGLLNDARKLNKSLLTMTVQRFVTLADDSGTQGLPEIIPPRLTVDPENAATARAELSLVYDHSVCLLALCPGAEYGEAKRWPAEYYVALARRHIQQGDQIWLFGSKKDFPVCEEIAALAGKACHNLAGRTSLAQAIDLLSLADLVVSNDSGLMHVAAALDRPLVAIYGSSDPGFTPPLNKQHIILNLGLNCSPCFKRECPLGHLDCLRNISVERVSAALTEVAHERRCGVASGYSDQRKTGNNE